MGISEGEATLLEKAMLLIDRYGIMGVMKGIFVIALFLYVIYNMQNFNKIIESVINDSIDYTIKKELVEYTEHQKEEHDEAMEYRKIANEQIPKIMDDIMINTGCDRVFIMEVHNGTKSMSGLPFTYGNITYEKDRNGIQSIADDYINLVLSRFPFFIYIEKNKSWSGSISDLSRLDQNLALRMESNEAKYVSVVRLHGKDETLGYLGVTYSKHTPGNADSINHELLIDAQEIAILIDAI